MQINKLQIFVEYTKIQTRPTELTIDTTLKGNNGLKVRFYSSLTTFALLLHQYLDFRTKIIKQATESTGYIHCKPLSINGKTLIIFVKIGRHGHELLSKRPTDILRQTLFSDSPSQSILSFSVS